MSMKHIRDCADEAGVDIFEYYSNERTFKYKGFNVEVGYNENSSSPYAWYAFAMGIGSFSGASDIEAIDKLKDRIDNMEKS